MIRASDFISLALKTYQIEPYLLSIIKPTHLNAIFISNPTLQHCVSAIASIHQKEVVCVCV